MTVPLPPPPGDLPALPARPHDGHKGTFGRVVVLAGSPRYSGAAVLCARAALRTGAGLARIGCPATVHSSIAARVLCETTAPLPDVAPGVLGPISVADAVALSASADAVALGPGLGDAAPTFAFVHALLEALDQPTVIDADALNALSALSATPGAATSLPADRANRVFTPHPGEAARLLGRSTPSIQADRAAALDDLTSLAAGVWVLKGAGTLIGDGTRSVRNATGNSGLASGGTGDVLTGIVASLLAQGMPTYEAAVLGVWLHGRAGDHAARRVGEHALMATDLLDSLPTALLELS